MGTHLLLYALCILLVILICILLRTVNFKRFIYLLKGDWAHLDEELGEENLLVQQMDRKMSNNPDAAIGQQQQQQQQQQQLSPSIHNKLATDGGGGIETSGSLTPQWGIKVDLDSGSEGTNCEELSRSRSMESIASSIFSNTGNDDPTVVLTIQYQKDDQMLQVEVLELYDAPPDISFYLLIYLLPHPKPLWKTETLSTTANPVFYRQTFRQCIRPKDVNKIALSVQLHNDGVRDTLQGQNRIPLRHLDLNAAEPISVPLLKNSHQGQCIGELYISLFYQRGRLSVAVLQVRNLNTLCDEALIRIYLVESSGRVIRKRTSPRKLVDGGAVFNESVFINLSRTQLQQSTLRLSLTQRLGMPSFGRATIGPKADDKGLVHWQRMLKNGHQQLLQIETATNGTTASERVKKTPEHGSDTHGNVKDEGKSMHEDKEQMGGEAKPDNTQEDEKSCMALKSEYDNLCSKIPHPQVAIETAAFCTAFQNNCKKLLLREKEKAQTAAGETKSNVTEDDAACYSLREEFEKICFKPPTAAAARETKAFCSAYATKCRILLRKTGTHIEIDYVAYCKKELERFRYVCPDPLRFQKHAADALAFCERYSRRCPHEQVPTEPVPFHRFRKTIDIAILQHCMPQEERKKKEYYMRELEYLCNGQRHFAETYCKNTVALKLLKYLLPCLHYKFACVDVFTRVIYTG